MIVGERDEAWHEFRGYEAVGPALSAQFLLPTLGPRRVQVPKTFSPFGEEGGLGSRSIGFLGDSDGPDGGIQSSVLKLFQLYLYSRTSRRRFLHPGVCVGDLQPPPSLQVWFGLYLIEQKEHIPGLVWTLSTLSDNHEQLETIKLG